MPDDKDPIEDLLEDKVADAGRQSKDLELWHNWHQNGRQPEHLEPLLQRFQPLINQKIREWKPGPMVSPAAFEGVLTKHVIGAIQSYNPDIGAALNTHVHHRIQKAKRFVVHHQNVVSMPEPDAYQIGKLQRAQTELEERFGRQPTHQELSEHMGIPVKRISKIQGSMMKDVPGSTLDSDPMPAMSPREQEVLSLIPSTLKPDERRVFDLIYHPESPVTSTGELAQRLGKSPSQISRIKTRLINKVKQYT